VAITSSHQIWSAILSSMPRGGWIPLPKIYELVEGSVGLTTEDHEPEAEGASQQRWQRNVRNVLQQRKAVGEILWDGEAHYMLPAVAVDGTQRERVAAELSFRMSLWQRITGGGVGASVVADVLKDLRIHVGEQGIFRDKARTARLTGGDTGVTVSLLHTGRFYADDLGEHDLLYHYPKTARPRAYDEGEVEATKDAGRLGLPVFVILPSQSGPGEREVRLGWVADWDDESEVFLVSFGDTAPEQRPGESEGETPFELVGTAPRGRSTALTRPGQQRFKFRVFKRYGARCAVCGIAVKELLDAVHIRPREEDGSNDPRNGLVLCASHHRAFDAGLFAIHPETMAIRCRPGGPSPAELMLGFSSLQHLGAQPHVEALRWRWGRHANEWTYYPAASGGGQS